MQSFNKLFGSVVTTVLVAGGTAAADEPTLTDPPGSSTTCEAPQTCPVAQAEPMPAEPPPPAPAPAPQPTHTDTTYVEPEHTQPWYAMPGFSLTVGGGVDAFVGDAAQNLTSTGGSWNVRASLGTRNSILGVEGSYIGSAQSVDSLGLDNNAILYGNGAQGAIRLNLLQREVAQPFLYGGGAWRHYSLSNTSTNTSDIADSADVFELPFGVGVAGYIPGGLVADVRAEYRAAWGGDNLFPNVDIDNNNDNTIGSALDRWGITGSIGAEF